MRLLIVEDDELLLKNLEFLLGSEREIELLGGFTTGEAALSFLKQNNAPDLILLDLELPGMHGIEFIKKAKSILPDVEILVHTIYGDKKNVFSAIKAGASGYILKGATPRELIEAINEQFNGGVPMSPKIARAVIKEFQGLKEEDEFILTAKEISILKYIEEGYTYKEIGQMCNISPNTVHTYVKKIYQKLHAKGRKEAIIKARRKGII